MAISCNIDKDSGLVELVFDSPPSIDDFQTALPEATKGAMEHGCCNWLIILDYSDRQNTPEAKKFAEFVINDLKGHIEKIAVVCAADLNSRMEKILEPVRNQRKSVAIFGGRQTALLWLTS